jgi:putative ABC transport system substrate-binding protein
VGRNLQLEIRYGAGNVSRMREGAAELINLAPEVIVTTQTAAAQAVLQQTTTIPIVFTAAGDPAVSGLVKNIARPEGNITGFATTEPSIAGKWLALLKEAAPSVTKVGVIYDPDAGLTAPGYESAIQSAAPALSVEIVTIPASDPVDAVHAIDAFAATTSNGGLLVLTVTNSAVLTSTYRLAVLHRMPAIYQGRTFTEAGGLMSYGTDIPDLVRRSTIYVDRLLNGAKVSDLPVQFPTKYELVVNLKTAKAIELTIPEAFLLRADEVIE